MLVELVCSYMKSRFQMNTILIHMSLQWISCEVYQNLIERLKTSQVDSKPIHLQYLQLLEYIYRKLVNSGLQ